MKRIFLFLLLSTAFISNAQNVKELRYQEKHVSKLLKKYEKDIKKDITSEYKDLIGKTLISDKNNNYEKIHFINEKYFLKTKKTRNVLGVYKRIKLKGISTILLSNEGSYCEALIFSSKTKNKYLVSSQESNSNNGYSTTIDSLVKENFKDKELPVHREIDRYLYFKDPNVSLYIKNRKIGIRIKEKKLFKTECDSLFVSGKMATIYNDKKIYLYNINGKLLEENLKSVYRYSGYENQIIDSENKMYFIDTLGTKYKKPKEKNLRYSCGHYSSKMIVTYYAHKNKILKTTVFCSPKNKEKQMEFDPTKPFVQTIPDEKDFNFIKKALKNKKDFNKQESSYYFNDEIDSYYSDYIEFPKNYKKIRFTNNSRERLQFEDTYHFQSYIIVKKSNKYGIWDIEKNKIIVPFKYKKIIIKNESGYKNGYRFILKKNRLYTSYPNIGLEPKYKYLGDYIINYARFEYPNGKKGWVDYQGIEYMD